MDLNMLMRGALGKKVPAEFSAENYDYNAALRDELSKIAGTPRLFRRNRDDVYDLMSENLDEELPKRIQDALGSFCDFMAVRQGQRAEFRIRRGKQRGKLFVTRSTASGTYETFRLDRDSVDIYPVAIGGAGYVDFERYLDGIEEMSDIYEVIIEGMLDRIFEMVQEALLSSWKDSGRPSANKVATSSFDPKAMRALCTTVSAYGSPVIYCPPEFAAEMLNVITWDTATKISDEDAREIREYGYIGKFYGTPVVRLPQSFADDKNNQLLVNPSFAYVIPAGKEKIVKVVAEGDSYFKEWENRGDNGMELQAYKKIGVGIVSSPNYWGIYYNAGINADGWTAFNSSLVDENEVVKP